MKKRALTLVCMGLIMATIAGCGNNNVPTGDEISAGTQASDEVVTSQTSDEEVEAEEDEASYSEDEEASKEDNSDTAEDADDNNEITGSITASASVVTLSPMGIVNGQTLAIGEDIAVKLDKLGDYDYEAAPSCLGAGEDKTYTFDSVIIYTRPEGARDNVFSIELDEGASLPSGIVIGTATVDNVKAVYGDGIEDNGDYLEYEEDGILLDFEVEDDVIVYAEIYKG